MLTRCQTSRWLKGSFTTQVFPKLMQYGIQVLPARVDLCTCVLLETSAAVPLTLVTSLVRGAMSVAITWVIASNALTMATVSTMVMDGGITCLPHTKVLPGTALNFFAAELASENIGTGLPPPPEEGEDGLLPKKRKHQMHLFIKGHGGKIWKAKDPKDAWKYAGNCWILSVDSPC